MKVIDADAHVLETEHTWDYLAPEHLRYRPVLAPHPTNPVQQYWIIDSKVRGFRFATLTERQQQALSEASGRDIVTPTGSAGMDDVALRLEHMDRLGIDIQVLHNTLFIEQATDRPEVDVAICKAWNRWMADVWKQGNGRLLWTCVPPLLSIDHAIEEMRFARANGAVGALIRPIENDKMLVDPYFYPIFEEAVRLDMPMAVHIANASQYVCDVMRTPYDFPVSTFLKFRLMTVGACFAVLMSSVPKLFPKLRWGFIESAAQWVPWIHNEVTRRARRADRDVVKDMFTATNIYVTCQTDDDIPYVLKYSGEDSLMIGTDYGHSDPSTELDAISILRDNPDLTETVKRKILYENPARLYGI